MLNGFLLCTITKKQYIWKFVYWAYIAVQTKNYCIKVMQMSVYFLIEKENECITNDQTIYYYCLSCFFKQWTGN